MKHKKKHFYGGLNDQETNGTHEKNDYGSGVASLSLGLVANSIIWLSNQGQNLWNFVSNNSENVFYHFVFILSYIVCLTTLSNTENENIRYLIIIFILLLHIIFLFVALNTDVSVTGFSKVTKLILFSPYLFGIGWLFLTISISIIITAYSVLYKKYTKNQMDIQFGSLNSEKNKYIYFLIVASIWMWIFYLIERIRPLFLNFFNENQIMTTIVLLIGMIFIGLSAYTIYISYKITNSVQKLNLPPMNSFQSFYQYFMNLANEGQKDEFNSYKESFESAKQSSDKLVLNVVDPSNESLNEKIKDQSDYQDINADELIYKDSTLKMMDKLGLNSDVEFTTTGLTKNDFCMKQIENAGIAQTNSNANFDVFLLSKRNKDLYYITNNPRYSVNFDTPLFRQMHNSSYINSVIILSRNSNYKENIHLLEVKLFIYVKLNI